MIRVGIAAILALMPCLVWADLLVRSGQHDGFTRLTIERPNGVDWMVHQTDQTITVQVDADGQRFDTDAVFDRISRARIASVSQGTKGGPLQIELNCPCKIRSFAHSDTLIVVDVLQAPPKQKIMQDWPPIAPSMKRPPPKSKVVEGRILATLDRAAGQGLLPKPAPGGNPHPDPMPLSGPPADSPVVAQDNLNLRTWSALDQGLAGIAQHMLSHMPPDPCFPDAFVDVSAWGEEGGFLTQLPKAQRDLYNDAGQLSPDHAVNLARLYLFYGFGAEARQIASLAPEKDRIHQAIIAMSHLMDRPADKGGQAFRAQLDCASDAALWAWLAYPAEPPRKAPHPDAILRAFSKLPPRLQAHLGPALSQRFTASGDHTTADILLNRLGWHALPETPDLALAKAAASSDQRSGDLQEASKIAAKADASTAPLALIAMIDQAASRGQVPTADQITLLASYEREYQGTPVSANLRRAQVTAFALSSDFDAAAEGLVQIKDLDGVEAWTQTRSVFLKALIGRADDVTFLDHTVALWEAAPASLTDQIAVGIAGRALALGFYDLADQYLQLPTPGPRSDQRMILQAQVALDRGLPHQSMLILAQSDGAAADQLRALALSLAGDYKAAGMIFDAMGNTKRRDAMHWLNDTAPEGGAGPAHAPMFDLRAQLQSSQTPIDPLPPLAQAQALLDRSQSARLAVEALMAEVTP